jgi:hypothetical protein
LVKKQKHESTETNSTTINTFSLSFPLPCENNQTLTNNVACLVKTYDNFDNYKINGIYEFIGILSQDPTLAYTFDEHGDAFHEHNFASIEQENLVEQFKDQNLNNEQNSMETDDSKSNNQTKPKKVLSSFVSFLFYKYFINQAFLISLNENSKASFVGAQITLHYLI